MQSTSTSFIGWVSCRAARIKTVLSSACRTVLAYRCRQSSYPYRVKCSKGRDVLLEHTEVRTMVQIVNLMFFKVTLMLKLRLDCSGAGILRCQACGKIAGSSPCSQIRNYRGTVVTDPGYVMTRAERLWMQSNCSLCMLVQHKAK